MTISKIALVTGGSRGLGKNMAQHLAARGTNVLLTYRSQQAEADAVVAELQSQGRRAAALRLDVGQSATFDQFFADVQATLRDTFQAEKFDFLVNNAGVGLYAPFAQTTEAQFDEIIDVHLKGPYFLTQKALPFMNDGGRIVNISSGLARFAYAGSSAYGATKGAIDVLTRYQALELGPRRIGVNVVAPGAVETDFGGGRVRDTPELNAHLAGITALGRVGLPEDIGPVVAFLCSEEGRWINGQRIEASGGIHL